jgi:hypothetical protein
MKVDFVWGHVKRWAKRRELPLLVEDPVIWIVIDGQTVGAIYDDGLSVAWSWGQPPEKPAGMNTPHAGPPKPGCDCAHANGGVCRKWQLARAYGLDRPKPPVPCRTHEPFGSLLTASSDQLVDHTLAFADAYVEAHAAKLVQRPFEGAPLSPRYKCDNYTPGNVLQLCVGGPWGHVVSTRGQRVEWLPLGQCEPVVIRKSGDHVRPVEVSPGWSDRARQSSTWGAYWKSVERAKRDSKGRFVSGKPPKGADATLPGKVCSGVGEGDQERQRATPGQHVGQPAVIDIDEVAP